MEWTVPFARGKDDITPEGDAVAKRIYQAAYYYPLYNVTLVGYADSREPDPERLAARRAKAVSMRLAEKYHLKTEGILLQTKVLQTSASKVAASIAPGSE